jgi:hypothetical protein
MGVGRCWSRDELSHHVGDMLVSRWCHVGVTWVFP